MRKIVLIILLCLFLFPSWHSEAIATHSFSKVGDSISFSWAYLFDFAFDYDLGPYTYLQSTVDDYMDSFIVNPPIAAYPGWTSEDVLLEGNSSCGQLSPLECAYIIEDPDIALILLGTNDVAQNTSLEDYRDHMQQILDITNEYHVIPVLITIPPFRDREELVEAYNFILRDLAYTKGVYLIDYWAKFPEKGLSMDGVHPSVPLDHKSAYFDVDHLQYGFNVLNLNILQMLYRLDK